MVINQGDIYWLDLGTPRGSGPGYRRPYMVVQNNAFNRSGIQSVIVCGITSNINRAQTPGNVLLRKGEAGEATRGTLFCCAHGMGAKRCKLITAPFT